MNKYSEFFRFDSHAHFVSFVVYVAALFEKRGDTINLPQLATGSSAQICQQAADEVAALLKRAEPIASKVMILRSNLFAHRNASLTYADAFKKANATPNELRELTELAMKVVNRLLRARGANEIVFAELPLEDVKGMLETLANHA